MKVFQVFERDINREFSDIAMVNHQNKALDIYEYVVTENIEDIFGCFLAHFFDSNKFPKDAPKARIVKKNYPSEIGPGVWLSGPFGAGKSQLLKIMYVLFTIGSLDYSDAKGNRLHVNIISTIKEKIRKKEIANLLDSIKSFEYMTFIFSANQLKESGDTIIDYLPKAVAKKLFMAVSDEENYSVSEAAEFLNNALLDSGKKRMIFFIDDIVAALDTEDQVRNFNALLEILDTNIWFIVSSIEGKEKLDSHAGKVIIEKFGQEQILSAKNMADIVKQRYLAKKNEAKAEIEKAVNLAGLQEILKGAASLHSNNVVDAYPFYPFQIAYLSKLFETPSDITEMNLMKLIRSIVTNSEVQAKALGYFVDIELIYEQLESKLTQYSKLILGLENEALDTSLERKVLLKTLKAVILLAQVNSAALTVRDILAFVYSEDSISDEEKLLEVLTVLVQANFIGNAGSLYSINANYPEKAELPVQDELQNNVMEGLFGAANREEGSTEITEAAKEEEQIEPAVSEQDKAAAVSTEESKSVEETIIEESPKAVLKTAEAARKEEQIEPAVSEQDKAAAVSTEESKPVEEPIIEESPKAVLENVEAAEKEEQIEPAVPEQDKAVAVSREESKSVEEAMSEESPKAVLKTAEPAEKEEQIEPAVSEQDKVAAASRKESKVIEVEAIEPDAERDFAVKKQNAAKETTTNSSAVKEAELPKVEKAAALPEAQDQTDLNDGSHIILNPKYVFESFVVGNSNRFAHAVSQAVAESPGQVYNPLFLYGGVGLGKTHLMHAIGHRIQKNHPKLKVVYISTETFTNELINALRDGKTEGFRQKYRNVDVLMVDDIQFLSKQEHAQEEFFHTFNTLHAANKQIVISSDRPPREIQTLEDRLRSRFQMGLITDIQSPDLETRIAILSKKAIAENFTVPNDVMVYIASHIDHNIRELEGALTRVMAFASVISQPVDINLATQALRGILPDSPKQVTVNPAKEAVSSDDRPSAPKEQGVLATAIAAKKPIRFHSSIETPNDDSFDIPANHAVKEEKAKPSTNNALNSVAKESLSAGEKQAAIEQTTNNLGNAEQEAKPSAPKKKSMFEMGQGMHKPIRFQSSLEADQNPDNAADYTGMAKQQKAAEKSSDTDNKAKESGFFSKMFKS